VGQKLANKFEDKNPNKMVNIRKKLHRAASGEHIRFHR